MLRAAAVPAAIALGTIAIVCSTTDHYGLTYDEGWYISRSVRAREWAGALATDPGFALSQEGIRRYWAAETRSGDQVLKEQQPGAVKLVGGLLGYPVGLVFGVAFPERAGTALFLAGCLVALYVFIAGVWGRAAGWFAVGALLLMPRAFAHAHLCALDVPVMSMMLIAVALMFAAVQKGSLLLAALSGLAWGVALSCKINALFVPLILAAWILLLHRGFALRAALSLAVGGPVGFLATWPWLWHHTGSRLADYLHFHLQHYPVAVSYFGHVSAHQPWHYPLVMTAITTPPVTLLLGLIGIGLAARELRRKPSDAPEVADDTRWRRSQALLVLLGALFTIGFNCLPSAPKYTGVRLFLPFFAFLAALAAISFGAMGEALARRVPAGEGRLLSPVRVKVLLAGLALLPALRVVLGTHPYQLSYYNVFIGGTRGAVAQGLEATYWGDSYMAVCNDLAPRLQPGDTVWVDLPGCQWIIEQYLKPVCPDLRFASSGWPPPETSWAIVQNKASELSPAARALMASGPPLFAAELDGVPLSLLYGRDSTTRAREQMPPVEATGSR
jgi:4-amino-4-deoxy-L-arabinose transferase-like glycosyltransferase